jgi:hypothetical protein
MTDFDCKPNRLTIFAAESSARVDRIGQYESSCDGRIVMDRRF